MKDINKPITRMETLERLERLERMEAILWEKTDEKAREALDKYERIIKRDITSEFDELLSSLMVCHYNDIQLDFDRLLGFDDFSLVHDIEGINKFMNRDTGKMDNHFRPRCAA